MDLSVPELIEAFKLASAELFVTRMQRDALAEEASRLRAEVQRLTSPNEEGAAQ